MSEQFKVGNVVTLRSGSLPMTVTSRTTDGFWCAWIHDGKCESGCFPQDALEYHTSEPKPSKNNALTELRGHLRDWKKRLQSKWIDQTTVVSKERYDGSMDVIETMITLLSKYIGD